MNVQIGRFATVVGNWLSRHQSWDNPFINAPLVYENVTAIYDVEAHPSARDFVAGLLDAKYEYNPAIWGPSYATGASVSGRTGKVDYAVEIKNASLSSRPESWDALDGGFSHPTVSGRIGYRPDAAWNIGFSASDGAYFRPEAAPSLPAGKGIGDYHERVLGQDISFAWHHLQLWAEVYEARFNVPHVGAADTVAWYFEAKYKFTPQMFAAFRWNQQVFNNVSDGGGGRVPWGHDIWRADTALGYRLTPHTQLKLQYSFQHETSSVRDISHMIAAQFTVRF